MAGANRGRVPSGWVLDRLPGEWPRGRADRWRSCREDLQYGASPAHTRFGELGVKILLIRLKPSDLSLISIKDFLFLPSSMAIRCQSQIVVRLLREMGLTGIVAEHPGKPFLLA